MKKMVSSKKLFGTQTRIAVGIALVLFLLYGGASISLYSTQKEAEIGYVYNTLLQQLETQADPLGNSTSDAVLWVRWSEVLGNSGIDDSVVLSSRLYDEQGSLLAQGGPQIDFRYDERDQNGLLGGRFSLLDFMTPEELPQFFKDMNHSPATPYVGTIGYYSNGERIIPVRLTLQQCRDGGPGTVLEGGASCSLQKDPPEALSGYSYEERSSSQIWLRGEADKKKAAAYRLMDERNEEAVKELIRKNAGPREDEQQDGLYFRGGSGVGSDVYEMSYQWLWRFQGKSYYMICEMQYDTAQAAWEKTAGARGTLFVFTCLLTAGLAGILLVNNRKKQRLEEKRRELTNSIAHELKTPLAVIHGYGECLLENISQEKSEQYLRGIVRETETMAGMIQDMLELSRLELQGAALHLTKFVFADLVREEVDRLRPIAGEKQAELVFMVQQPDAVVSADREKLRLVLSNFLSNAICHTQAGGEIRIEQTTPNGEHVVRLSVWNPGELIPPEKMEHLWDAFYRTDEARERAAGGSGLGLAIARQALVLHRAAYGCRNTKDGVEFWFELEKKE